MRRPAISKAVAKARSLIRAGPRRQALVIEAVASLAAARIVLAVHPFSRVAKRLGTFTRLDRPPAATSGEQSSDDIRLAREIGWAVRAAAPWMPFRAVCLQQAMAARAMLGRRGIPSVLHLGAGPNDSSALSAHAWLDAAGARVTGYPVAPQIVEIGTFN